MVSVWLPPYSDPSSSDWDRLSPDSEVSPRAVWDSSMDGMFCQDSEPLQDTRQRPDFAIYFFPHPSCLIFRIPKTETWFSSSLN